MRTRAILALSVLLALPPPARAFFSNKGVATAQFLRIGAGARALGMGDAFGPIAEGPTAMYWNPAGLAQSVRPEIAYSHIEMLRFFHHDHLAYVHPVPLLGGNVGASATFFYQDTLDLVSNTNQIVGTFGPHSEAYSIAYARAFQIGDFYWQKDRRYFQDYYHLRGADRPLYHEDAVWEGNLLLGLALKFIHEEIHTNSANAFAFDGGALFRHTRTPNTTMSFTFRNAGNRSRFIREFEPLPLEVAFGISYDWRLRRHRILPAFEIGLPSHGNAFGKLGIEYSFPLGETASGAVRTGFNSLSATDLNPLSGLTGGVGVDFYRMTIDIGFQPMAELGEVYRMSLGYKF